MNCLIAKIKNRSRTITYRKVLTGKAIYSVPDNLNNSITYNPGTLLDDDSWYKIDNFSKSPYFQEMMRNDFSSVDYDDLDKSEFEKIDYLCSYQEDVYFFQNVSRTSLQPKCWLHIGDDYKYVEDGRAININKVADAIYLKSTDTLFFVSLSKISGIFKGISELYREATDEETVSFLRNDFISLENDFGVSNVKTANRKRIAMAVDTLKSFTVEEKKKVFKYIGRYCSNLKSKDNTFSISNEDELKKLLWGIEQRYYTTIVGNEPRVANSIIALSAQ